jgi:hypothetical protein
MKFKDDLTALRVFEEAAFVQSEATEAGDYRKANRNSDKIAKAAAFLKEHNELYSLSALLQHESSGVRVWAAAYLLPIMENVAVQVLESIADDEKGIQGLCAKTTLAEWRNGTLML